MRNCMNWQLEVVLLRLNKVRFWCDCDFIKYWQFVVLF